MERLELMALVVKVYMINMVLRKIDVECLLEFAEFLGFVTCNLLFKMSKSYVITHSPGGAQTQIDFILKKLRDQKLIRDIKVVPSEECVANHQLLICSNITKFSNKAKEDFTPKVCLCKLKAHRQISKKECFEKHCSCDKACQCPAF